MQCMKCGRDLEAGEVFCTECRENMKQYPVKPGTVVQLPYRPDVATPKKPQPRRKTVTQEERLKMLEDLSRRMALALVIAIALILGLGYTVVSQHLENREKLAPGQNYSVSGAASRAERNTEPNISDTQAAQ